MGEQKNPALQFQLALVLWRLQYPNQFIKVTRVTSEYNIWPKKGKNCIKRATGKIKPWLKASALRRN